MNKLAREISFRELWFYLCSGWKKYLIWLVIGLVLAGAYSAYGLYNYHKSLQHGDQDILSQFTEVEKDRITELLNLYDEYDSCVDNMNSDYLYTMNPYEVYRLQAKYYINNNYTMNYSEDIYKDNSDSLVDVYRLYAADDTVKNRIIELGIDGLEFEDMTYLLDTSVYGCVLSVYVRGKTAEDCKAMFDVVNSYLQESSEDVKENVGEHEFKLVSTSVTQLEDTNIENASTLYDGQEKYLSEKIKASREDMSDTQLSAVDTLMDKAEDEENNTSGLSLSDIKPYALKSAVIVCGLLVVVIMFYAFKYAFSTTVKNRTDISSVTGCENVLLGSSDSKDSFTLKRCRAFGTLNSADEIAGLLSAWMKKNQTENLTFVTDEASSEYTEKLCGQVKKAGYKVEVVKASELAGKLEKAENVFLVSTLDKSGIAYVSSTADTCRLLEIGMIGSMIIC